MSGYDIPDFPELLFTVIIHCKKFNETFTRVGHFTKSSFFDFLTICIQALVHPFNGHHGHSRIWEAQIEIITNPLFRTDKIHVIFFWFLLT